VPQTAKPAGRPSVNLLFGADDVIEAKPLDGMDQKLVSITFSGSHENLVVGQAGMQAGGN